MKSLAILLGYLLVSPIAAANADLGWCSDTSPLAKVPVSEARIQAAIETVLAAFPQMKADLDYERESNDTALSMAYDIQKKRILVLGTYASDALADDVLILLACHETGHVLGGHPHKRTTGLSTEPQSDYFATARCLPRVFSAEKDLNAQIASNSSASIRARCRKSYPRSVDEQNICVRSILAAQSWAKYTHWVSCVNKKSEIPIRPLATLSQMDTRRMRSRAEAEAVIYPSQQCRLDTFVAGALCNEDRTLPFDNANQSKGGGRCRQSGGVGQRPRCWYFPSP